MFIDGMSRRGLMVFSLLVIGLQLAIWGAVLWVAWHFISKFW